MKREQSGDKEVAPENARRRRGRFGVAEQEDLQQEEEEDGVGAVEGDVDHVRTAGVQAENLAIQHVGNPREGVPVVGLAINKGPFHTSPGEAGADGGIVVNVCVVVVGDELVVARGPINGERDEDEERAGENVPSAAWAGGRRVHAGILGRNGGMPRFFIDRSQGGNHG